jgi:hypothetical protein
MAVNGIEIEAGQKWLDRTGNVVEIDATIEAGIFRTRQPVTRDPKATINALGKSVTGDYDLIALVEYADGFKPWAGGEQPEETRGKVVWVLRRDTHRIKLEADSCRKSWAHSGADYDIVGYKIAGETPAENDGFIGTGNIYIKPYVGHGESSPPLNVEMLEPAEDDREYTGGSVSYYRVRVAHPTSGGEPYDAECNDIIEALGMNFAEGNAFKAIWRLCAARNGLSKRGYDEGVYDAEKVVFFGQRMVVQQSVEGGAK